MSMVDNKTIEEILQFIHANKTDASFEINENKLNLLFLSLKEELLQTGQLKLDSLGVFHLLSGNGNSKKISFVPSLEIKSLLDDNSKNVTNIQRISQVDVTPILKSEQQIENTKAENLKKDPDPISESAGEKDQTEEKQDVIVIPKIIGNVTDEKKQIVIKSNVWNKKEDEQVESPFSESKKQQIESTPPISKKGNEIIKTDKEKVRKTENTSYQKKISRKNNSRFLWFSLFIAAIIVFAIYFFVHKKNKDENDKKEMKVELANPVQTAKTIKNQNITINDSLYFIVTTEKGSNLLELSKEFYGHDVFWIYIYQENKEMIDDPVNLPPNIKLRIPKPNPNLTNANDPSCIKKANELAIEMLEY